jgi:exopolyphosphatase/guanosine-5'-triphosphate,3'-diphosphate pyrophosphatase
MSTDSLNPQPGPQPAADLKKPKKPPNVNFGYWMRRVLEECVRAGADFAPDPVHDLRVALRRCRSIADGMKAVDPDPVWRAMKKAGKSLFQSLGELRDVQVMAEWVRRLGSADDPETRALLKLLSGREVEQRARAAEALKAFDQHQWRKWSRELPARAARVRRGSAVFKHLALERWSEAYELHRQAMRNRSQVSFHRLRIGIKRFRYLVENFLPQQHAAWSTDLKELQDLLGEVHDFDVLWTTALAVNAFAGEESRIRWHESVQAERNQRLAAYRARMLGATSLWRVWRAGLPQGDLVQTALIERLRLWASMLDPDPRRSQRVAELAGQLFDALEALGMNPVDGDSLRSVLFAAALMQDVGRSRHERGHHKTSYRLIHKMAPPLGWSAQELQMAAAVARFHRGALPRSRHPALQPLSAALRRPVMYLAGVLRLANALDLCQDGTAQRLKVEDNQGAVIVRAPGFEPLGPAAAEVAAARYLLELVLRRPILIQSEKSKPQRRTASKHRERSAQSNGTPSLAKTA